MPSKHKHPNGDDLYTPITPELIALFERMRAEHGTWRKVAALSETKLKVLRNLRRGDRKAISQTLLDRICQGTRVGSVHEFIWFTADDLVALGIWEPVQYVEGMMRVQGDTIRKASAKKMNTKMDKPKMRKGRKPQR